MACIAPRELPMNHPNVGNIWPCMLSVVRSSTRFVRLRVAKRCGSACLTQRLKQLYQKSAYCSWGAQMSSQTDELTGEEVKMMCLSKQLLRSLVGFYMILLG